MSPIEDVTQHEIAILQAYLDRGSAKEAARDLGLHYQHVKNTLALIRSKLDVTLTAQAVLLLADRLR